MATGQDRNNDVVVDAEPFTESDQPTETPAGDMSESESSDDDYPGPGDGDESQRVDVAHSGNRQVTDTEVSNFLPLLPYKLKEGVIHVLIINADEDRREALQFKTNLEANVKLLHQGRGIDLNFRFLNEVMGDATRQLDTAFKKSVFILLFATKYFVSEKWPVLQSYSCLMESLQTEKRKWHVVPVNTAPKKTRTYKLPMDLKHLRSTDYWRDTETENECYRFVQSLLENHFNLIVSKERQLREKRISYCEKHYQNLQKNFAHIKSASYPSLREDVIRSTDKFSVQDSPHNQQQTETASRSRSSNPSCQGITTHPFSCPAHLCQISAGDSQENPAERVPHVATTDTWETSSNYHSRSESHAQQHPQLPKSGATRGRPTVSSVVERSVANVDSYISTDDATSTSQPVVSGIDTVHNNSRQIAVTSDSSVPTLVPDDQANDNDCIEVIPNAAADEAEVNEKEETSRAKSSSTGRRILEPEEDDIKDEVNQTLSKETFPQ